MANPLTGSISLKAVQSDLIMTTGNASLNDSKFKDFNNRTNTSNSLKAYDKKVWSQGRTKVSTSTGTAASTVKPYHWDVRLDNISSGSVTNRSYYNSANGSPSWGQNFQSQRDRPCAVYNCGFAKLDTSTNRQLKLIVTKNVSEHGIGYGSDNSYTSCWVYSWSAGYLSGTQQEWLSESAGISYNVPKSFDFQVNKGGGQYLQIVFRHYLSSWNGVMGYERYTNADLYDLEVLVR
jgi:hypothetical protein